MKIRIVVLCTAFIGANSLTQSSLVSPTGISSARHVLVDPFRVSNTTWQRILITNNFFCSISFENESRGIVVGVDQTFCTTEDGGITWKEQRIPPSTAPGRVLYSLEKVCTSSEGRIFVLGQAEEAGSAIFVSSDFGVSWDAKYYQNSSLNAVSTISSQAWIVGRINGAPVVLHSERGKSWKTIWRRPGSMYLTDIDFVSSRRGWMVGASGALLYSDDGGRSWRVRAKPTRSDLEAIGFLNETVGYAVGKEGTILRTVDAGIKWTKESSGSQVSLMDVAIVSTNEAWVVGQKGTVLHTEDAGLSWQAIELGTRADLYGITMTGRDLYIASSDGSVFKLEK